MRLHEPAFAGVCIADNLNAWSVLQKVWAMGVTFADAGHQVCAKYSQKGASPKDLDMKVLMLLPACLHVCHIDDIISRHPHLLAGLLWHRSGHSTH